jgi:hypothetical protein
MGPGRQLREEGRVAKDAEEKAALMEVLAGLNTFELTPEELVHRGLVLGCAAYAACGLG